MRLISREAPGKEYTQRKPIGVEYKLTNAFESLPAEYLKQVESEKLACIRKKADDPTLTRRWVKNIDEIRKMILMERTAVYSNS